MSLGRQHADPSKPDEKHQTELAEQFGRAELISVRPGEFLSRKTMRITRLHRCNRTRISEEMSKTVFRVGTESRSDVRDADNWPTEAWHREDIIQPYRLTGSLCCRSAAFCAEGAAATHSSNKGGKLSRRVTTILRLCALFPKNSASSSSSGICSQPSDMALLPARSANSR